MGTQVDPHMSAVGIGLVRLAVGILAVDLMRRYNKRPLFIYSSIGQAVFIFVSGYYTKEITEGMI